MTGLSDDIRDLASDFVLGLMPEGEMRLFEELIARDPELSRLVSSLRDQLLPLDLSAAPRRARQTSTRSESGHLANRDFNVRHARLACRAPVICLPASCLSGLLPQAFEKQGEGTGRLPTAGIERVVPWKRRTPVGEDFDKKAFAQEGRRKVFEHIGQAHARTGRPDQRVTLVNDDGR